jgi:hypothetical protein
MRARFALILLVVLAPASVLAAGSGTWKLIPSHMHDPRLSFAATVGPNKVIYAMGGYNYNSSVLSSAETFSANKWTAIAPMPAPRRDLCAVTSAGRVFAIGGNDGTLPKQDVFYYKSNVWATAPPVPTTSPVAACSRDAFYDIFYVFTTDRRVFQFDIHRWTWRMMSSMAPMLHSAAVTDPATGNIYYVNGSTEVDIYHPGIFQDYWTLGPPMPTSVSEPAALGPDGRMYLTGGPGNPMSVYSFTSGAWTTLAGQPDGEGRIATGGGSLLYFGGWSGTHPTTATFRFAP